MLEGRVWPRLSKGLAKASRGAEHLFLYHMLNFPRRHSLNVMGATARREDGLPSLTETCVHQAGFSCGARGSFAQPAEAPAMGAGHLPKVRVHWRCLPFPLGEAGSLALFAGPAARPPCFTVPTCLSPQSRWSERRAGGGGCLTPNTPFMCLLLPPQPPEGCLSPPPPSLPPYCLAARSLP